MLCHKILLLRRQICQVVRNRFIAQIPAAAHFPGQKIGGSVREQAVQGVHHLSIRIFEEVTVQLGSIFFAKEFDVIVATKISVSCGINWDFFAVVEQLKFLYLLVKMRFLTL